MWIHLFPGQYSLRTFFLELFKPNTDCIQNVSAPRSYFPVTWWAAPSTRSPPSAPPPCRGEARSGQSFDASWKISSSEISQVCTEAHLAKYLPGFLSSFKSLSPQNVSIFKSLFISCNSCIEETSENTFVRLFTPFFLKILHQYWIATALIVYTFSGNMFIVFEHIVD